MPRSSLYSAIRIALLYLLLGVVWIALSDRLVDVLASDHRSYTLMQTWKGWFYVAFTALLLYLLVMRALSRLEAEMQVQRHLSDALAETRQVHEHLLASLDDVVWLLDLRSQSLLFVSAAAERIYGLPVERFLSDAKLWLAVVHVEDRQIADGKQALLNAHGHCDVEYRIVRPDGGVRWLRDRTRLLRDAAGEAVSLIGIATDTTAQHQNAEHIHRLANYDSLTGLPNRIMLEGMLHAALQASRRDGTHVALFYVDIARLKDINDTFGHGMGDEVLRRNDIVARLGADEFAVAVADLPDPALASQVAQRIIDAMTGSVSLSVGEIKTSASVGVSLFPADGETPDLLLQLASLALHEAKPLGSGHYRLYQASMSAAISDRVALASDLHHALERKELEIYYQPQIDLGSGRVLGVEALLRWHHPLRGMVSPARFIPLAEENGLIVPIGAWVLEEACRQARAWQLAGLPPMTVAVNISAVQFREAGLCDTVVHALQCSQLDPQWLELEVTESGIMDGAERMLSMLSGLRQLGVQLSIDDFGTGYSSLAYLTRFDITKLKIDQAFVGGAPKDSRDAAIVSTIIQMGKALSLRVIAEGVETEAQAELLRRAGCDEGQGYLFARPLPAAELVQFIQALPGTNNGAAS